MKVTFNINNPPTFLESLWLVFLGLKLGNLITWSWLIIFIPLYIEAIANIIIFIKFWRKRK